MATNPASTQNGAEQEATGNGTGIPAANGAAAGGAGGASLAGDAAGAGAGADDHATGAGAFAGDAATGPHSLTAAVEPRPITTAKDISLKDFLNKMDDYAPIIPDAVTNYYMTKAGLPPPPQTDPRLARLLALATQKFVADIAADAYQYSRVRASNTGGNSNNPMGNLGTAAGFPLPGQPNAPGVGSKDQGRGGALGIQRPGFGGGGQGGSQNRTVLTMEDLGMAVGEYGVNVKRGEFYR
ncbi:transcription initiation factor TFIID subunit 10 [Sporothrix brasiliensis 5110]|uniref:Transcription initiation factor TFIID subunit 10 n=1 Tax=Sporothrix brasiliensis 5110 TaxID=1398154 RepID=A0A0C2ILB0_9PEZI|nr:transcription initiation factor TFIID subunit 10 [Sporothrix brasiliensis 5110]KIH89886.1 transcription initiation factor TFIID subunit 10 [Sporothrix brasiliensis 5110]